MFWTIVKWPLFISLGLLGISLAGLLISKLVKSGWRPSLPRRSITQTPPAAAPAQQTLGQKFVSYVFAAAFVAGVTLALIWLGQPRAVVVEAPTPKAPVTAAYRHADKVVVEAGTWQEEGKVDWTKVKSTITIPKDCRGYYLYNPKNEPFAIRLPDGEVLRSNNLITNTPRRYLPLLPGKELKLASLTGKPIEVTFHWN